MKSNNQTKMELSDIDLSLLASYIEEYHDGNILLLSNWLGHAIYMFHYLPEDVFSNFERQNTCHILKQLHETFFEIYLKQNS